MPKTSAPEPRGERRAGVKKGRMNAAKVRLRSCVACRGKAAPVELTRWVFAGDGAVFPDLAQGAFGRGAWLHPRPACLRKASAGFSRSFKERIAVSPAELATLLSSAAERRVAALLGAARRSHKLLAGKTAVDKALEEARCSLVVVACDARAAVRSSQIQQAIGSGRAVAWGSKQVLGGLTGRMEAGVLAVLDDGLANALKATIALAQPSPCAGVGPEQTPGRVSEERAREAHAQATESSMEVG